MTTSGFVTFNNGLKAPWLAFGTGTAIFKKSAKEPVTLALKNGVTHIDAAEIYENEDTVGEAIAEYLASPGAPPRSSLFVTTKLKDGPPLEGLKKSLAKLRLDYVDLYLIHFPMPFEGRLPEVWKEFEEAHRLGLAKSIGVSNFRLVDLEKILPTAVIPPSVNQIEFHPHVLEASLPLLNFHKKHNIVTASYAGLSPLFRGESSVLKDVVAQIAKRLSAELSTPVTDTQVLQLWMKGRGVLVVTTSSKAERIRESLAVVELPALSQLDVNAIEEAGKRVHLRHFFQSLFDKTLSSL